MRNNDSLSASHDADARLLDVQAVAAMLDCSPRHVYRLADSGKMPRPVKLGALVRWHRPSIEDWLADGCPKAAQMRQGDDDAK